MGCGSSSANDVVPSAHSSPYPMQHPANGKQFPGNPHDPHSKGVSGYPGQQVVNPAHLMPPQGQHPSPPQMGHHPQSHAVPTVQVPPMTCVPAPPRIDGHDMRNDHHNGQTTHNIPTPVSISEEHLEHYVELEKEIHKMEKERILQKLHQAVNALQCLQKDIAKLDTERAKLENKINSQNDHDHVTSGKELIKEIDSIDDKTSQKASSSDNKEHSVKQLIESQLKVKRQKYQECEQEIVVLNGQAACLLDKYLKLDEIIGDMFGQVHASKEEANLKMELCTLEERKERIAAARRKWKEAQLLLEYACKQLAVAVQQWQDMPDVPTINLEVRYTLSEANQLAMARQEKDNHREDWKDMPVCSAEELAALEVMANGNTASGQQHTIALTNCSDAHKQAVATLNWFNQVLNTGLQRDLVDVCEEVRMTSQALRKERIGHVKAKLKEKYGKSFDMDADSICDEEEIKKMLSVCKDGDKCKIKHDDNHTHAIDFSTLKHKSNVSIEEVKLPTTVKKIVKVNGTLADHTKVVEKLNLEAQQQKAQVEKKLDEQLLVRRDLRAKKGPPANSTKPEEGNPNVAKPEIGKPNLDKPHAAKPNLDKPKPEAGKPNMGKPDLAKPEMAKANGAKAVAGKAEGAKKEVDKAMVTKNGVAKSEGAKGAVAKGEVAKAVVAH